MNAYILVNEWCNSTESGYDILNVYESKENAIDAMHEAYLNFVEECKEKQVSEGIKKKLRINRKKKKKYQMKKKYQRNYIRKKFQLN